MDRRTHGSEDLGRIVPDGILTAPLLEEKDNECDNESDEIAFSKESTLDLEDKDIHPWEKIACACLRVSFPERCRGTQYAEGEVYKKNPRGPFRDQGDYKSKTLVTQDVFFRGDVVYLPVT
jgi:hypothetical protein